MSMMNKAQHLRNTILNHSVGLYKGAVSKV